MDKYKHFFEACVVVTLFCGLVLLPGCSQKSRQGAGQGAAIGGAAGAVGGIVTALVFGGNVGEAAARGAVWAASSGAVAGGIAGAQAESAEKQKERAARIAELKKELGDDAYDGLVALAECKHEIALGYARTSAQSKNNDYALAGLWLEVLTEADRQNPEKARALIPQIIERDKKIKNQQEAEAYMDEAKEKLKSIRDDYSLKESCQPAN